jgi:NodT family efflux transporter outer membrane factor (OMF) lipoprotein
VDFSYEADVWGRVRRGVEGSVAGAQASSADVETALLSITAELALDYVELRGLDTQASLLDETVAAYGRALELTRARFAQGVASGVDVAQAETQLDAARVQATDLQVARAQLEHAIASLTGAPPAALTIDRSAAVLVPPVIPVGLPSRLLERRPDIAAAERRVASANAAIGAARAAFFPALLLSGGGGVESSTVASLLSLPSRFWSLGPSLIETVVDGGRRRAIADQAIAAHDESVAAYRQSVLTAFQEVEDNLVALRVLADEARQAAGTVDSASRSLDLANQQFAAGVASYLPVITAQTAVLSARLTAVDIQTRQLASSVLLVKALGGGWSTAQLPEEPELRRSAPKREAP